MLKLLEDVRSMIEEKAGYILSALMASGATYGEIFFESSVFTRVSFESKKLDKVEKGIDMGVGLRIIKDFKVFYGYTTEISFENLMELARSIAKSDTSGPVVIGKIKRVGKTPYLVDPLDINLIKRVEILKEADEWARSFSPYISQVKAVMFDKTRNIMIINNFGENVEDEQKRVIFFTEAIAQKDGDLQRGYESMGILGGFELFSQRPAKDVAIKAAQRAALLIDAKPGPAGTFEVVMSSEAGGTMVHEAVGHGLEADLVQQGMSVYQGKIGKKIASELVSVVDDATLDGKNGSFNFDDEGVIAKRKVLIKDGYLEGYMYDRLRAMKEGKESTGNGRRQSYAHIPIVRMTNTFIERGKDNPEDIIKSVKRGVYVKKMGGGEVNTVTGDFVFEVMEGYMIENGEIAFPIKGATLIGNGPKALEDIEAVGNDEGFSIGTCGKNGQGVPVTDAQPTIKIRALTLGGCELCKD